MPISKLDLLNTTAIRQDLDLPERKWYTSPVFAFFVTTILVLGAFLWFIWYGHMQLTMQMVGRVERDAERIATHFRRYFDDLDAALIEGVVAPAFRDEVRNLSEDYGLWKVKVFTAEAKVIFSSDPADEGTVNADEYFTEIMAAGKIRSELITKQALTLEGQPVPVDVVEVYVPVMEGTRFRGAFEIYIVVTDIIELLDATALRLLFFVTAGAGVIFLVLGITAIRSGRVEKERTEAEQDLVESERRFRRLIEAAPTGAFIVQNGGIVYRNPLQKSLQDPFMESLEMEDFDRVHPEDRSRFETYCRGLDAGEMEEEEISFRYYPEIDKRSAQDMRWATCRAGMIEYGEGPAVLVNMIDITQAKRLENLVRTQDKLVSLGRVSAGIAHEIRNPLSGININIDNLKNMMADADLGENDDINALFKQILTASQKIEGVIERVMDFTKPGEPEFRVMDVNQPVEDALGLTQVTLRKNGITLEKRLSFEVPACRIDARLIEQVVMNLIGNASDILATLAEGQRSLRVSTGFEKDMVVIRVEDSGPGVARSLREEIFEPFYTSKPQGSGIGLSLCYRIISDHGGGIRVGESDLGGAKFTITLIPEKG